MSGGSLDYFYNTLQEHVGDFRDKELDHLVKDLATLFHDREWFLSGDTCEGTWNEARDHFKKKWFTEHGRQERIEEYLAEFEDEIKKTFGMSNRYCRNCEHWHKKDGYDGEYGSCDLTKVCMMHRSENCEYFSDARDKSDEMSGRCGTCAWHTDDGLFCGNPDSEFFGNFRNDWKSCDKHEVKKHEGMGEV